MEYIICPSDELTHHGTKGMRWGIRRYQNKDGSLTAAGKKRYNKEMEALKKESKIVRNRQATKAKFDRLAAKKAELEAKKRELDEDDGITKVSKHGKKSDTVDKAVENIGRKKISEMTDAELFDAINRARMEDTYRQLRPEQTRKPGFMQTVLNDVAKPAAINAGKQFLENALKQAGNNLLKGKVDPDSVEALTKVRDKLKLKNEISKLKNNPEGDTNWENMIKKQTYERNKKKYDAEDAAEQAAKKAKEDAEKQAKKEAKEAEKQAKKEAKEAAKREREMEKYNEFQENYRRSLEPDSSDTYRNRGGAREYVNPNESRSLAIVDTPVTSLSTTVVSRGKSAADSYSGWNSSVLALPSGDSTKRGREIINEDGSFYGYADD